MFIFQAVCFLQLAGFSLRTGYIQSIQSTHIMLFNVLQSSVRYTTNCSTEVIKRRLDRHLSTVPDEPQIPGYTACRRVCWAWPIMLPHQTPSGKRENRKSSIKPPGAYLIFRGSRWGAYQRGSLFKNSRSRIHEIGQRR